MDLNTYLNEPVGYCLCCGNDGIRLKGNNLDKHSIRVRGEWIDQNPDKQIPLCPGSNRPTLYTGTRRERPIPPLEELIQTVVNNGLSFSVVYSSNARFSVRLLQDSTIVAQRTDNNLRKALEWLLSEMRLFLIEYQRDKF